MTVTEPVKNKFEHLKKANEVVIFSSALELLNILIESHERNHEELNFECLINPRPLSKHTSTYGKNSGRITNGETRTCSGLTSEETTLRDVFGISSSSEMIKSFILNYTLLLTQLERKRVNYRSLANVIRSLYSLNDSDNIFSKEKGLSIEGITSQYTSSWDSSKTEGLITGNVGTRRLASTSSEEVNNRTSITLKTAQCFDPGKQFPATGKKKPMVREYSPVTSCCMPSVTSSPDDQSSVSSEVRAEKANKGEKSTRSLARRKLLKEISLFCCLSCGSVLNRGEYECCGNVYCNRKFCSKCIQSCYCYNSKTTRCILFDEANRMCVICKYQHKRRPYGEKDWHFIFHDREDLKFSHLLRGSLPYVPGLFVEIHPTRPPCWRKKVGDKRSHFSFKHYGGILESRLASIIQCLEVFPTFSPSQQSFFTQDSASDQDLCSLERKFEKAKDQSPLNNILNSLVKCFMFSKRQSVSSPSLGSGRPGTLIASDAVLTSNVLLTSDAVNASKALLASNALLASETYLQRHHFSDINRCNTSQMVSSSPQDKSTIRGFFEA